MDGLKKIESTRAQGERSPTVADEFPSGTKDSRRARIIPSPPTFPRPQTTAPRKPKKTKIVIDEKGGGGGGGAIVQIRSQAPDEVSQTSQAAGEEPLVLSQTKGISSLLLLPDEKKLEILDFLPANDLIKLAQTNKRFRDIIFSEGKLLSRILLHITKTKSIDELTDFLTKNKKSLAKIKTIDLSSINNDKTRLILINLRFFKGLKNLKINSSSSLKIGAAGILINEILQGRLTALQKLDLANNLLPARILSNLLLAIDQGTMPNIEELNLYFNDLTQRAAELLKDIILAGNLQNLITLNLGLTSLGPGGVAELAKAIKSNGLIRLQILILNSNNFQDEGVIDIMQAIQTTNLPELRVLDLANNNLTDTGVRAIIQAIRENRLRNLEILDLQVSDISQTVKEELLDTLREQGLKTSVKF